MALLLSKTMTAFLAAGASAIVVWLTVRLVIVRTNLKRKRWISLGLAPAAYLLSFGPFYELGHRGYISLGLVARIYYPLVTVGECRTHPIARAARWYAELATNEPEVLTMLKWQIALDEINRRESSRRAPPVWRKN